MGAKAWELRAVLGLAGLLRERGEGGPARAMVVAAAQAMPEAPGPAEAAQIKAFAKD